MPRGTASTMSRHQPVVTKARMNAFSRGIAALLIATSTWAPLSAAEPATGPLIFNTTAPTNDLQGTLSAQVQFAQSQIIPARPREGDRQPHLIGYRKCLLLVRPLKADGQTPMVVTALDAAGKTLGTLKLAPPDQLPKTAYFVDGAPEGDIDFTPKAGPVGFIRDKRGLDSLTDPKGAILPGLLRQNAAVEIQTADGLWVRDIHLPKGQGLDGKVVSVRSQAGYGSTIYYSGRSIAISKDQALLFKCVRNQWLREGDLENNGLVYAEETWSGLLPAEWIVPGLRLRFQQGELTGELADLKVGAPTELLIHTIDLGMLAQPRNKFEFAKDPEAHREYFQTAPTSRLIVSQYAPLFLPEVMLPDGTLLSDQDPSKGDWHNGTMRQRIGKELISLGIDNANYGINSTPGEGEDSHPYLVAQLAAHASVGKYSNGLVVHGGSGGGGIVTLDDTLGNEFSHEVGHNYGLGHYVGGFEGSAHRGPDGTNSTWGWDADKNRFIPNFFASRSGKESCVEGRCQSPFDGRTYGLDAMAGGAPFSGFNRFTLYTPYSAAIIQKFLESKAIFDSQSPTGFSKWNADTRKMEPFSHTLNRTEPVTAPVKDIEEKKLAALLAESEHVKVAMQDGNWTKEIDVPPASPANRGRLLTIDHEASYNSTLILNGENITVSRGFKKSYASDGKTWKDETQPGQPIERKPEAFGVPVTTLVGYYDPQGDLTSYIYPALYGAYGFTYADDRGELKPGDCHLEVQTSGGTLRFRLHNRRFNPKVMNKFHVNIPTSSQPKSVSVIKSGEVLDKRTITKPTKKLTFTIHGTSPHEAAKAKTKPATGAAR
jgi:hypothetical protein